MKSNNNLLGNLDTNEVNQLLKAAQESTKEKLVLANKTILSTTDLWNIQKMTRPRVQRRFLV